jgi:hypothetical protein
MKHLFIALPGNKIIFLMMVTFIFTAETVSAFNSKDSTLHTLKRLNFVISSKQKKFDPAPFSFQLQSKLMRLFHKDKMHVIIVRNSAAMAEKITSILKEENAMIGNLWFDSHGHWQRRRSLFEIGEDEFNSQSIRDSAFTMHLKKLSAYCDSNTKVGIGSCYGGATYTLPAIENFPAARMNGDSLMISVSKLFGNVTVFASESFVMTGPGIMNSCYALTGYPGRKKFRDPIYAPVWEKLGEWNYYSGKKEKFEDRVSVSLHQDGNISFKEKNYLDFEKNKKKLSKKILALKRGNYNMASLYQHKSS